MSFVELSTLTRLPANEPNMTLRTFRNPVPVTVTRCREKGPAFGLTDVTVSRSPLANAGGAAAMHANTITKKPTTQEDHERLTRHPT